LKRFLELLRADLKRGRKAGRVERPE